MGKFYSERTFLAALPAYGTPAGSGGSMPKAYGRSVMADTEARVKRRVLFGKVDFRRVIPPALRVGLPKMCPGLDGEAGNEPGKQGATPLLDLHEFKFETEGAPCGDAVELH